MKKIITKKQFATLFLMVSIMLPGVGMAPAVGAAGLFSGSTDEVCKGANLSNSDKDCKSGAAGTRVQDTVGDIVNLLTAIVGIAAVIMIIINGFRFVTANGDSNSISAARTGIIYALVGLVIAAMAQIIVRFVLTRF